MPKDALTRRRDQKPAGLDNILVAIVIICLKETPFHLFLDTALKTVADLRVWKDIEPTRDDDIQ